MKVLVLGGTQFIGRHVVEKILGCGHDVTLCNRGKTGPDLFPELPLIRVDRQSDAISSAPELRQDWDAVVDMWAYYPKDVKRLLSVLKGHAGAYIQLSTVSAYTASSMDRPTPMIQEDSPLQNCTSEQAVDTTMATYGQRKAECERVAMEQHPGGIPTTILRPSIVFGPHDHTDRFAYWIWRAAKNTPFILPDDGLTMTRRTYAPDLASALVTALSSNATRGHAYNIAETDPMNFRDTLTLIGQHLGTKPLDHSVSIESDRLLKENIQPWIDLPLWLPRMNLLVDTFKARRDLGFISTSPALALATSADAFLLEERIPRAGLSPKVEEELISRLTAEVSKREPGVLVQDLPLNRR